MAEKTIIKIPDFSKTIINVNTANKENDPKGTSFNDKQKDDDDIKSDDDIKLDIGEHYHVRRADDSWRK